MPPALSSGASGVAFLVSAGIVYEIIAKDCSSPQTAEINIDKRESTLMKWVNIGVIEAALMVVIASFVDPPLAKPIILGGTLAAGITYAEYLHARQAGLNSCEPGTED